MALIQCLLVSVLALLIARSNGAPMVVTSTQLLTVPDGEVARYQTLEPNPDMVGLCTFEAKGDANAVAIHNIMIPGSQDEFAFMSLVYGNLPLLNNGNGGVIVNVNNPTSDWKPMEMTDSVFCGGHTHTSDGRIAQAGGHVFRNVSVTGGTYKYYAEGLTGVRILAPSTSNVLQNVNTMQSKRWYPSLQLLADGLVLIVGGVNAAGNSGNGVKLVEILDPAAPTAPMRSFELPDAWMASFEGKSFYPLLWALPTGHIFILADDGNSCILNHHTGQCMMEGGQLVSPGPRPGGYASTYPFTGSAVMTMLEPDADNNINQADIIVFGGSKRSDHPLHTTNWVEGYNQNATACKYSHRFTISWSRTGPDAPWQYTFSDWTEEDIGYPRVMPDTTLLPNGDVVITSGAQSGVAGYPVGKGTIGLAQYPAFWSTLYQPDKAAERYTLLCGTQQVRGYHATAALTLEGKILIAGADRNRLYYDPGVPWFHGSTNAVRPAYNIEIMHPPYVYDTANKPEIVSINAADGNTTIPELNYNTRFTLTYQPAPGAADVSITSVVLVAPSSTTHSFNFNQRVVKLLFTQIGPGQLSVLTPVHPFVASPQYFMVFVNNVKTYSTGKWVRLVDTDGLGKQVPLP